MYSLCMRVRKHLSDYEHLSSCVLQEGNADSLQIERQSEEELRADFITKSLGSVLHSTKVHVHQASLFVMVMSC